MKNLIIVDDHAMLREGISSWISKNSDWNILFSAENFSDLKTKFSKSDFSYPSKESNNIILAVVDLSFRTESSSKEQEEGWEIISWLKEREIDSIVFSSHDSGHCIEKAVSPAIGAKGFVSKCSTEKTLLEAINTVASGKSYIQPDLFSNMIQAKTIFQALSPKEQQIAELVLTGLENFEIADKLALNIRTVENYISKLYDKCGANTRKALIDLLSK